MQCYCGERFAAQLTIEGRKIEFGVIAIDEMRTHQAQCTEYIKQTTVYRRHRRESVEKGRKKK